MRKAIVQQWVTVDNIALPAAFVRFSICSSVSVIGRRGDEAHRLGQELDPATIPSTERRARHLLELARGYAQTGDQLAVVYSLGQAVDVSPETIAFSPAARDLARQLLRHSPASTREDVQRITARMGMTG